MPRPIRYYLVAAEVLPEVFRRVAEARRLLESREARTVDQAVRMAGISRSAFYKYRDAVFPFSDIRTEHIVTFQAMLRDTSGVLSRVLAVFAASGANILTINQSIPTNGCAAVTISAESSGLNRPLEELMDQVSVLEGVVRFQILSG